MTLTPVDQAYHSVHEDFEWTSKEANHTHVSTNYILTFSTTLTHTLLFSKNNFMQAKTFQFFPKIYNTLHEATVSTETYDFSTSMNTTPFHANLK